MNSTSLQNGTVSFGSIGAPTAARGSGENCQRDECCTRANEQSGSCKHFTIGEEHPCACEGCTGDDIWSGLVTLKSGDVITATIDLDDAVSELDENDNTVSLTW
jgi:hypothetical protein